MALIQYLASSITIFLLIGSLESQQQLQNLTSKPTYQRVYPDAIRSLDDTATRKSIVQTRAESESTPTTNKLSEGTRRLNRDFFGSLVSMDTQANKSKLDVHIPIVFDMTNDKDSETGRAKLDLSVLGGLVTVNRDRSKANGTFSGPLTVSIFGIPVYSGIGTRRMSPDDTIGEFFSRQGKSLSDSIEALRTTSSRRSQTQK